MRCSSPPLMPPYRSCAGPSDSHTRADYPPVLPRRRHRIPRLAHNAAASGCSPNKRQTTLRVTWSTLSGNRTRLPEHSLLTSIWVRLVQCLTACAIAMAPASPNELPATRWTHAHASIIHDGTRPTPRVSHDRNPLRSPPLRHNPSSVQLPCLSLQWVMASANAVAPSAPMWSSVQREKPTVTTAHAHGSRRYDSTRAPLMSTKSISLTRSSAWATLTVSASSVTAAATSQHGQLCDGSQLPNTRIAAVTYACCAGTANRY